MAESNLNKEFQAIVNFNQAPDAAEDPMMKKLVRWILHRDESIGTEAGKDFYSIMFVFHKKYGIDQDGFDMAMKLCEEAESRGVKSG